MQITLDEGYNAMCDFVYLGYVGEVNARQISVLNYAIPEATAYKLKIEYPDKTVYEIPIKNGMCSLGASIFKTACEVKCQIIAYAVEGEVYKLVRKSDIFKQEIRSSIDETGIPSYEESLDALDKILQYESNSKEYAERAEAAAIKSEESESKSTLSALNASKSETAAAGYAKTAKTNADSTAADRQAVQTLAEQVTADKTIVVDNAAKVAEDRTAAETAAQTAQSIADSLPDDYVTAVGKIAENTAEIANVKLTDKELKRRVDALYSIGQGITHQFETDTDTAYTKTVPTGAKLMSVKSVGGRSIIFNQSFQPRKEANNGATATADSDGTITINGTTTASYINFRDVTPEENKIGKYAFKLLILNNPDNINMKYGFLNRGQSTPVITSGSSAVICNQTQSEILLGKSTGISGFAVGTVFNDVKIKIQIFDLTAMFGSGNEPTTAEEFEKIFPADYYPYNAGEVVSAGTEEVAVGDTAYQIPEAIRNLPGYGWSAGTARNYVDYENKRYVQCVGSVDLGTLTWMKTSSQSVGDYFYASVSAIGFKRLGAFGITVHNILCSKYITVARNPNVFVDKTIVLDGDSIAVSQIQVKDTAYTDATAFKQAMQDVMLYYELATPIVTDISDLLTDDFLRNIEVEAGGSVTFKNSNGDSYRIPVPSEEEYIVKLSEVGGTT